jgi:PEP-CTERM motif
MRSISTTIGTLFVGLFLAAGTAQAIPLLDVTGALTLLDPTQTGRLSRDGVPSDWSGPKAFPGVLNPSTTYHYEAFLINVGMTPFIQISDDTTAGNLFFSAYDTTYSPDSAGAPNFGFDTNYLGDAGFSGDPFPGDPQFFQVVVPANHNLLVIVNNTAANNVGVGDSFHLLVEGFIDSQFTDPPPSVPEPTTMLLSATGLAFLALKRARQRARQ